MADKTVRPVTNITHASVLTPVGQVESSHHMNIPVTSAIMSSGQIVPILSRTGKTWVVSNTNVFPSPASSFSSSPAAPVTSTSLLSSLPLSLSLVAEKQYATGYPTSQRGTHTSISRSDQHAVRPLILTTTPKQISTHKTQVAPALTVTPYSQPLDISHKSQINQTTGNFQLQTQYSQPSSQPLHVPVSFHALPQLPFQPADTTIIQQSHAQTSGQTIPCISRNSDLQNHPHPPSSGHVKPGTVLQRIKVHGQHMQHKPGVSNLSYITNIQGANMQIVPQNFTNTPPNLPSVPAVFPRPTILRKREPDGSIMKVQKNLIPLLTTQSAGTAFRLSSPAHTSVASNLDRSNYRTSNAFSLPFSNASQQYAEKPPVSIPNLHTTKAQVNNEDRMGSAHLLDSSPRKKPRKQQLGSPQLQDSKILEDMKIISGNKTKIADENIKPVPQRETKSTSSEKKVSIYGNYKHGWKARHHHFETYDEVRYKEEKKPSLNDIVNQKGICRKIGAWKMYHLCNQLNSITSVETEVADILRDLLDIFESRPVSNLQNDLNSIKELLKGNMQRSAVVADQMSEIKVQVLQMLNHKRHVTGIIRRFARPKKKITIFEKDLLSPDSIL